MRRTVILNVVGLTPRLLERMPRLRAWAANGKTAAIRPVLPAVTCSVQATYLTGTMPERHGIVGNGWYSRDDAEIRFWKQSNRLIQAPKIWEVARSQDPGFTCSNMFWWFNMHATVDFSLTPRPMYPADGRKIPDLYAQPAALRDEVQREFGRFPLFEFWGPRTSARSSRWIAEASMWVDRRHHPTLTLIYLPHLDYNLQRLGPEHPGIARDLAEIDNICAELIAHYEAHDAQVVVLSEYGIAPVHHAIPLNRVLREHGLIAVREELGRELLDPGASKAFAVADHQVAHVYINDPASRTKVRTLVESLPGVETVLDAEGKANFGVGHARAGDLVLVAGPGSWFSYYYWLDDRRAPDFARTVDIHRKPGYDPVELFIDPALRLPELKVGLYMLRKALGFRGLLEIIPLDACLVKGSHGRLTKDPAEGPVVITRQAGLLDRPVIEPWEVFSLILRHLGAAVPEPIEEVR